MVINKIIICTRYNKVHTFNRECTNYNFFLFFCDLCKFHVGLLTFNFLKPNMGKIKLKVLGLSYSQTQSGAYALVLAEENGERRIPIIIGGFEAQAIAIELEALKPPRPLTHDLFVNFAMSFKIDLVEVNIHKLEEGIFYSELLCDNGSTRIKIDARTSDAVALAIRFDCPIYTTKEILDKAGIILPVEDRIRTDKNEKAEKQEKSAYKSGKYTAKSLNELQELLDKAINEENYEEASHIRDEIKRREG